MNHSSQLNSLLVLQKKYKDFMPICPNEKVKNLSIELQKVSERISKINTMNIEEAHKEVPFYFETKQSKINFLNS